MSDVTLRVTNTDLGRPARVQMLDTRHKLHGEAVLGPGRYVHDFAVPKGPYIIQIERAGARPEQVLRVLDTNDHLDVAKQPDATAQEAAEQRQHVEATRRRTPPRRRRAAARKGSRGIGRLAVELSGGLVGATDLGTELDSDFLGSILAQYTGRRRPGVDAEGIGVVRERSGVRLPEAAEEPTPAEKAKRRRAKLRSRFRLTVANHATIPGQLHLRVENGENVPGDKLIIHGANPLEVETGTDYHAPLLFLQERKSDIVEARFTAVPLFSNGLTIGFDAENKQVVRVESGNPGVDALLAMLSIGVAVEADAVAAQVFEGAEDYSDGMDGYEFAYRLLRDKFVDPYAAAVAGYFMLRFNKFGLLRDWSRNLADYFPFMSDGCIIEGWRRLVVRGDRANPPWPEWRARRPPPPTPLNDTPNATRPDDPIDDAARRFLEAHARGLPTFHFGLEKHLEGLMFCFDRTDDSALKGQLKTAIGDIAGAASRAYSSAGLTTLASMERPPRRVRVDKPMLRRS